MIPWRLVQTTLFCHNASRCGGRAGDDRIQSPREGRGGWLARGVAVRIQEWREQRLRRHRPVCRHRRHQPAEQLPRLAVEREGALPRVGQRVCGGGVDAPRGEVVPLLSQREPQRVQALLREGGKGEPEPEEAGRVDVVGEGLPHGEQLLGRAVEHLSTSRQRVVQSVVTQQRLERATEHRARHPPRLETSLHHPAGDVARGPKVDQHERAASRVDQQVVRLDVSVHDAERVDVGEGLEDQLQRSARQLGRDAAERRC
mmetsp:Transcript_41702/g.138690  ORF Transcript_41702/g.138690 Transcript_41702/m.138690 type:complete len:258 (-) Transcript_41702:352-1125(-)